MHACYSTNFKSVHQCKDFVVECKGIMDFSLIPQKLSLHIFLDSGVLEEQRLIYPFALNKIISEIF